MASALCPFAAWLSQIGCVASTPAAAGRAEFYLLLAVAQAILILARLVLSIVALAIGRGRPGTGWWPALAGLLLSTITLALVACLILSRL